MSSDAAGTIACAPDAWLAGVTGRPCHKVSGQGGSDAIAAALRRAGDGFFFAKIPVTAVALARCHAAAGMYIVDTNVTLEMPAAHPAGRRADGVTVFPARPADHEAAQDIAGRGFIFSRFHLDPLFPDALADHIKREWIRSYCEGRRGDRLFVAERGGRIAGFLAALTTDAGGRKAAVIDLVAVDAGARGSGVGSALVSAFQGHYATQVEVLRVGTQVANVASLALYGRAGFGIAESAYVLHAHVENGNCL